MVPDVTIMVPDLEIVKNQIENKYFNRKIRWNKKLPDLAPIIPPIVYFVLRNSWAQVPKWRCLKTLLACTSTDTNTSRLLCTPITKENNDLMTAL
jgi:hypothetical protein